MSTLFDVDEVPTGSTKSNEWYTPSRYIEAARAVMGGIDLDPASCELANMTVKASRYYTKEDNGLAQEWYGRVWLNPPYGSTNGKSNMEMFTLRLFGDYQRGKVEQAILLSMGKTCTSWFYCLWDYPLCFVDHNILFNLPLEDQTAKYPHKSHIHGTLFVYLGPNITRFAQIFSEFGPVVLPSGVIRRPAPVLQPTLWDKEIDA